MKKKVVFILGPTGSGKTATAVKLAKKYGGEIISADSRQVYVGLDVGSGKDLDELQGVPYHLIDICVPEEKFTMFDWLELARQKLDEIFSREHLPIVVGGTGLYAKALIEGFHLKSIGSKKPVRKFSRQELDQMPLEKLMKVFNELKITDKIDFHNPRRLIRAIEKAQEGTKVSKSKPDFESLVLAIDLPRDELYKKINQRVDLRFSKQKMQDEVEGLLKDGVSADWLKSLGLEYKFITMFLLCDLTREQMLEQLKWKTHAYARRQLTWLRTQVQPIWIKDAGTAKKLVAKFIK